MLTTTNNYNIHKYLSLKFYRVNLVEKRVCPYCHGLGIIVVKKNKPAEYDFATCPHCQGVGYLYDKRQI